MRCGICNKTDGLCYTSNPPKVRCTISGEFRNYDDACNIEFAPVVHAKWMIRHYNADTLEYENIPYIRMAYEKPNPAGPLYCSRCKGAALLDGIEDYVPSNYCPHCGAKMD